MVHSIFDSHAHYTDSRFADDADALLDTLEQRGVCGIVDVGCAMDEWDAVRRQSEAHPNVWFSVGLHPHEILNLPDDYLDRIEAYTRHPKCVAIGEIGLDYFRNTVDRDLQKRIFREQLTLAERLQMPVIVHTREAMQDTLRILQSVGYHHGVVHCFSGSAETAKQLLALGWQIGFTGVVTFSNAKKAAEAAAVVPLDRLLVETDCPYMAPVPHRGERCTSDMIAFTAEKLAEIKGVPVQTLLDATCQNAKRLYGIQ